MSEKMLVSLNNECTASGFYYWVTPAMWKLVEGVSEEEFGEAMPAQPGCLSDSEAYDYRDALVEFAREQGLSGEDLEVECYEMPVKWFDSGWTR